jgi:hypothetical protein
MNRLEFFNKAMRYLLLGLLAFIAALTGSQVVSGGTDCSACPGKGICAGETDCSSFLSDRR